MRGLCLALLLSTCAASAAGPQRVSVGVYLNDVQNLDLKSHSYAVDLYLWFRWKDRDYDPIQSVEFTNPYELWGHARSPAFEKPLRLPDGRFYQVLRVQGRFSRKLPLNDYPFDRQTLTVEFEDTHRDSEGLLFEADSAAVNPRLSLPGFKIGAASLEVEPFSYPTAFGDPRVAGPTRFSRGRLTLPIERPALAYSVKLLLPVLCVIFCASLLFLFQPQYVDARVGIGITALLTIVALQITLNADLPEVDYLILMDKVYLGAYLFVIGALGSTVYTTRLHDRGQGARAARIDRRTLAAMLSLYLAFTAAIFLWR